MENNLPQKKLIPFKFIIIFILLLIIANIVYLDIIYFQNPNSNTQKDSQVATTSKVSPVQIPNLNQEICPNSCLSQIYQATTSTKLTHEISPAKALSQTNVSYAKEFFVPFGSGSSEASDWEDVAGLKAYIDSAKYPSIKTVVFEASVQIPTGNETAFVRLYNETDKHPVWFSDVSLEGGNPQFLISKPITLEEGEKVYKVQMKTSLKYKATLNQARIRITTR